MREHFERANNAFVAAGNNAGACLAGAYLAHALIMNGQMSTAENLLARLLPQEVPVDTRALLLNASYWLAIDQGRFNDVAAIYGEQVELLLGTSRLDLAYQTSPPLRLPGLPGITGHLARHAEWLLRLSGDEPTPLRALGILSQAWVALWRGEIAEAHRLREQAREEADWSGSSGAVMAHLLTHTAYSQTMSGEPAIAIAAARERTRRQQHTGTRSLFVLATLTSRIAAANEDLEALRAALGEAQVLKRQLDLSGIVSNTRVLDPAVAQLHWLEGRTADAIRLWEQALLHENAIAITGQQSETRVRLARALLRQRQVEQAATVLTPALMATRTEACPGGLLMTPEALRELAAANWGSALPQTELAWLRLCAGRLTLATAAAPTTDPSGLSPREQEVLARIAAGDSNKLIARALDLSLHTVADAAHGSSPAGLMAPRAEEDTPPARRDCLPTGRTAPARERQGTWTG
jgi:LuxR family maltose regulon positive regulatory protein